MITSILQKPAVYVVAAVIAYPAFGTIVFEDNFNRPDAIASFSGGNSSDAGAIGNGWTAFQHQGGNVAQLTGGTLQLSEPGGSPSGSRVQAHRATDDFAADWADQLDQNAGLVTWAFNFTPLTAQSFQTFPDGFGGGQRSEAIILAATSANFEGGTAGALGAAGDGYALVRGNAGSDTPLRLVSFTGGVFGSGGADIVVASAEPGLDPDGDNLSIQVTYDPLSDEWTLAAREDGASFADPTAGVFTVLGNGINNDHTSKLTSHIGFYYGHNANIAALDTTIDNLSIIVIPEPASLAVATCGIAVLIRRRRLDLGHDC